MTLPDGFLTGKAFGRWLLYRPMHSLEGPILMQKRPWYPTKMEKHLGMCFNDSKRNIMHISHVQRGHLPVLYIEGPGPSGSPWLQISGNRQNDITEMEKWSTKWLMSFHPAKCKALKLGRPISDLSDIFNPCTLSNHHLEVVNNEKDIWVHFWRNVLRIGAYTLSSSLQLAPILK